jgi:hypothetical protein
MQQQIQRPVRRSEQKRHSEEGQDVFPQSAREFMKIPVSGLLSAKRLTYGRLDASGEQAK